MLLILEEVQQFAAAGGIEIDKVGKTFRVERCNEADSTRYDCENLAEVLDAIWEIIDFQP